jgi:hypothetical protein
VERVFCDGTLMVWKSRGETTPSNWKKMLMAADVGAIADMAFCWRSRL